MTGNLDPLRGTRFIRVIGITGIILGLAVLGFYCIARIAGFVESPTEWAMQKSNHGPWHNDWGWIMLPSLLLSFFGGVIAAGAGVLLAISNRSLLPLRSGAGFAVVNIAIFFGVVKVVYWVFD